MTGYQQDRPADGAPASQEPRRTHTPAAPSGITTEGTNMPHDLHAAAEHVAKHPHGRARYEAIFDTVHQQIAHDLASPHPLEAIKRTHAEYGQNKQAILDKISA